MLTPHSYDHDLVGLWLASVYGDWRGEFPLARRNLASVNTKIKLVWHPSNRSLQFHF